MSVLCHELGHALVRHVRRDQDLVLGYAEEELVAESAISGRSQSIAACALGGTSMTRVTQVLVHPTSRRHVQRSARAAIRVIVSSRLLATQTVLCP